MQAGERLSHYELIERIGAGGMGVVWRARDTNLDRDVAVKVLSAEFAADAGRLARFEREARLLASINHKNVATVYGLGAQGDTRFIAMELIPGEDLDGRLERETPGVREALGIARQIAAALEATHARGVIHRDLKPANVHIMPGGEVKVLDFGIARDADWSAGADGVTPEPTVAGSILGTVSYMSPEQARGQRVDARTDIWAFGCVLYRMLCGRPAFAGETRWDKLAAVLREEPDWSALPDETPGEVRRLLADCLVKDPEGRAADAGLLRRELESVLGLSGLTGEGPPLPAAPSRRWIRLAWTLAAVAALAGVYWGVFLREPLEALTSARSTAARSIAVLPFESLAGEGEDVSFAAGIHDDILSRVAKISDLKVISRTSVMEYRSTSKNLRQIADELQVATVLEGGVQRSGDHVRINVRLIEAATEEQLWSKTFDRELSVEGIFSIQSDIAGQVAAALQVTLSDDERRRIEALPTDNLEAYDAYLKGLEYLHLPGRLEENLVPARYMFQKAVTLDPSFAIAYAALSRAARNHHWFGGGGEEALQASLEAAELALAIAPDLPEAHLALGTYLYMRRDYDKALEQLRIAERGLPSDSELIRWKSYIVRRRGRWDEALRELRRARALDPRDVDAVAEVGFTLINLRRYDEAEAAYRDAFELAPNHPLVVIYGSMIPLLREGSVEAAQATARAIEPVRDVPWKYSHGWQALLCAGELERAAAFVATVDRVSGQWHEYPGSLLVGWTRMLQGDEAAASRKFEEAVRILEADLQKRGDDARLHASVGLAYAGLGRKDEALRAGRRAVALMPIERDTFVGSWLLQDLAWICTMTGELDAAVEALDRILSIPSVWSIELLLADPRVDPLREHDGFRQLVHKHRRSG